MNKRINVTLLSVSFMLPNLAGANDWAIGLIAGQSRTDIPFVDDCVIGVASETPFNPVGQSTCSADETGLAIGINASYQFTDIFSLEAGYIDLGETEFAYEVNFFGDLLTGTLLTRSDVLYLAGVASIDLTDRWSLSGRLNYYNLESKETQIFDTVPTSPFVSRDESDVSAGVSVNYELNNNWAAELRYDDFEIDVYTFGVKYTFGD